MIHLSSDQKRVVETPISDAVQVLASAGSGKTRVLTERVRFILENTKKQGVIALTFTNKAAEEMQDRLSYCDEAAERAWVATIHSVAERILRQYGHTIGLSKELHIYERDKDRMEVFIQSLRNDWVNMDEYLNIDDEGRKDREFVLREYMNAFSVIKRELLTEEDVEKRFPEEPGLWEIFQDYQNALLDGGGIDYDDILVYAHKLLLDHDWVANIYRARYKHLCVDEAQDLNLLQYEFIRTLCGDSIKSVMMVGDPDQMIYGFNGSSSDYLCKRFVRDFSATSYRLKENYRSSRQVIKAANRLKPGSQRGREFALEGRVQVKSLSDEAGEASWIVSSIKKLIDLGQHKDIEGNISLDHMVVIARNRFVFQALQKALEENSIPFFLRKTERMPEPVSLFGRILDYGVRIKLNSRDWVDGKKLCGLLDIAPPQKWQDDNILEKWAQKVAASRIPLAGLYGGLLLDIHKLDSNEPNIGKFKRSFQKRLAELAESETGHAPEIERSMEELEEFHKNWVRFKRKGLGTSLESFRNALSLGQLAEEGQTDGLLALSTVHTMKGLEKDIVFIMSMCEGVFPDYRAKLGSEMDEERNNAFVAVTRARRWLYITYPEKRTMPWGKEQKQTESRFIRDINGGNNLRQSHRSQESCILLEG